MTEQCRNYDRGGGRAGALNINGRQLIFSLDDPTEINISNIQNIHDNVTRNYDGAGDII